MLSPSHHRSVAECIPPGLSAEGALTESGFENTSPEWRIEALSEMRPYLLKGKVEQDFAAVTLTVDWTGLLGRSGALCEEVQREEIVAIKSQGRTPLGDSRWQARVS